MCKVLFSIRLLYPLFYILLSAMKACRTPRVTKPLLSLTMIDRGLQTNSLLIMSSENITHLTTLKTVVSASLSDGFRATRTSTPPSALSDGNDIRGRHWPSPGYPANGLCDIQTVTDGYKTKGSLLFSTKATAHSAQDHQTDVFCALQHILDSCDPPSCPRSPRLLGWHPRQKSHHPHDMVAPRPWRPPGHKSSTYSEQAEHLGWLTNWLWQVFDTVCKRKVRRANWTVKDQKMMKPFSRVLGRSEK